MSRRASSATIILVTTVSFLLSLASGIEAALDETIVLCLSFNEGNGTTAKDSSMYRFNGKVNGAKWAAGRFSQALKFDGQDDFVSVPDSLQLRFLNGCTLMAWINVEGQGNSLWPRIFCKEQQTGSNGGFHMPLDWAAGVKVRFVIDGSTGITSPQALELNKWYHAAVTCDGTTTKFYVDGAMIYEVPQEKPFPETKPDQEKPYPDLWIGGSPAGPRSFQGMIDEARIWSRALREGEIKQQMNMSINDLISVDTLPKATTMWGSIKAGSPRMGDKREDKFRGNDS